MVTRPYQSVSGPHVYIVVLVVCQLFHLMIIGPQLRSCGYYLLSLMA